jgi:hypothetical protein
VAKASQILCKENCIVCPKCILLCPGFLGGRYGKHYNRLTFEIQFPAYRLVMVMWQVLVSFSCAKASGDIEDNFTVKFRP